MFFFLLSLLLNSTFFALVFSKLPFDFSAGEGTPEPLVVELTEPPPEPEPQPKPKKRDSAQPHKIVENRRIKDERPPEKASYLSERDSRVEKEQKGAFGQPAEPPTPERPPAPEKAEAKAPGEKEKEVKSELAAKAPDQAGDVELREPQKKKQPTLEELRPSPHRLSQLTLPGDRVDPLDEIQREGALTFLNTKSYRYAGFVRRVAYQIFDHFLVNLGDMSWSEWELMHKRGEFLVEAVLDENGNQVEVRLVRSSGVPKWDELGLAAMRKGAWDLNPPSGAASADGKIHFLFTTNSREMVAGISN